jgi:hypothetical protein
MSESRHVASLVATHGLPEDMDLLIETLQEADGVRVNRIDGNYADIVIDEMGESR